MAQPPPLPRDTHDRWRAERRPPAQERADDLPAQAKYIAGEWAAAIKALARDYACPFRVSPANKSGGFSEAENAEWDRLVEERFKNSIWDNLDEIVLEFFAQPVMILTGPTGSGKSTQMPFILLLIKFILGITDKTIYMAEPRRIAVKDLPEYMSKLSGLHCGSLYGYDLMDESSFCDKTEVLVISHGRLRRMLERDMAIPQVGVLLIDEAHVDELDMEIAGHDINLLLESRNRSNLKTILMTATVEGSNLMSVFGKFRHQHHVSVPHVPDVYNEVTPAAAGSDEWLAGKPALRYPYGGVADGFVRMAERRQFPLEKWWTPEPIEATALVKTACEMAYSRVTQLPLGHELIFCGGEQDIEEAAEYLEKLEKLEEAYQWPCELREFPFPDKSKIPRIEIVKLHRRMSAGAWRLYKQDPAPAIRSPDGVMRPTVRIYLATEIAELSITIKALAKVFDTGLCKATRFYYAYQVEELEEVGVTPAQSDQRSGRCGRTGPGHAFLLYTQAQLARGRRPQIEREDMSRPIFAMAARKISCLPEDHPYINKPTQNGLIAGAEVVAALEAMSADGGVASADGHLMLPMPLPLREAKMLALALRQGLRCEVIDIVSVLAERRCIFLQPGPADAKRFDKLRCQKTLLHPSGGHATVGRILNQFVGFPEAQRREFCTRHALDYITLRDAAVNRDRLRRTTPPEIQPTPPLSEDFHTRLLRCLIPALLLETASLQRQDVRLIRDKRAYRLRDSMHRTAVTLSPEPSVYAGQLPNWIVYSGLKITEGKNSWQESEGVVHTYTEVPGWMLAKLAPKYHEELPNGDVVSKVHPG